MRVPLILGHRGFRGRIENTIPAFRRALKYADGIELDVRRTLDGKLVILHDGKFPCRRGECRAEDMTYLEIVREHPLGKLVTTLPRVLKELKPRYINIDLKDGETAEEVVKLLERKNMLETSVISTDSPETAKRLAREYPCCKIGLSIVGLRSLLGTVLTDGLYSVHVPLDVISYAGFTFFSSLIKRYHSRRLKVFVWNYGMNEIAWLPRVLPLADVLISDDPARLKRFLGTSQS
ncbi:glycerophosphodiester phosphodiesterase family protein [Thermococcus sp.]|uniref:glycerophosphodiester phosphodiesterase family protein n=1 Tax=Thermococcus sp. TaxID=35749 RepID=UPI00262E5811|nr:glycerophosphodiester phosphodiesterase family protein [Thermococcus sp.]